MDANYSICPGHNNKKCDVKVDETDDAIECDICRFWFHTKCQKLKRDAYKDISTHSLFWVCDVCRVKCHQINKASIKMVLEKLENIDNNISEFKSQTNENKNDIVKIENVCFGHNSL